MSSRYYNDLCYTLTTKSGTDECLKDRQEEYKNNKLFTCEEDRYFSHYGNETKKAVC